MLRNSPEISNFNWWLFLQLNRLVHLQLVTAGSPRVVMWMLVYKVEIPYPVNHPLAVH